MSHCRPPIEGKRRIRFGEVIMTAHLNRSVTGIGNGEHDTRRVGVEDDFAGSSNDLAGYHVSATIARIPASAATAPIDRNATVPPEPLAARHRPMPAA